MNALLVAVVVASYQPSEGPPSSLGGDLSKKPLSPAREGPLDFKQSVELLVAEKRREQIKQLEQLLTLTPGADRAELLFRLGDLYSEESRAYPDDAEAQRTFGRMAVATLTEIVQKHPSYARTDEVLYGLGKTLKDLDDDRRALIAFRRLIDKYPRSVHVPYAWLAFGDWYFEHRQLDKAVEAYGKVDGPAATLAAYKLGWCRFNQGDFERAMEHFRTVVLAPRLEKTPQGLAKEARADFVRAFARSERGLSDARELFNVLVTDPEDLRTMYRQLASLYFDAGRDREAALMFRRLVEERPDAPEAVDFENHIVEALLRAGNKPIIVNELNRIVRSKKANERTEQLFSRIAVDWHNEVRKTRAGETARLAAEVYAGYLELFPDNPKATTLRFFRAELLEGLLERHDLAGPEYARVAAEKGKWRETAAYDAVIAYQALAVRLTPPQPAGVVESVLPPEKVSLLEACDRYLELLPDGEHAWEVAHLRARTLYDYNRLRAAAERFYEVATRWPEHAQCEVPENLAIDALNLLQDYDTMAQYADTFAKGLCAAHDPEHGREQRELREAARFKRCTTPVCFEAITGSLRDKALFRAAGLREQAKDFKGAIAVRELLKRELPGSPLAAKNVWALAQAYEAVTDFDRAAQSYEAYPRAGERARDADYNAGILRGELGQYARAVEDRRRFLERWPKDSDAERVTLSIAELHEKNGRRADAVKQLEAYGKAYPQSALEALGRIAKLQAPADAKRTYARIAAQYGATKPATPGGLETVARAKLVAAEDDFARYAKLKLRWTKWSNPRELKQSLEAKTKALKDLERQYTDVIALGQADPGICGLYKIGLLYELFAVAVDDLPLPPDAPPEIVDDVRRQLPGVALHEKAEEAFTAATRKSHELGVYNACSTAARTKVSSQRLDELPEMKLDAKPPVQGLELLIELQ